MEAALTLLRLPYAALSWVFSTWTRKALLLLVLPFSFYMLHSIHTGRSTSSVYKYYNNRPSSVAVGGDDYDPEDGTTTARVEFKQPSAHHMTPTSTRFLRLEGRIVKHQGNLTSSQSPPHLKIGYSHRKTLCSSLTDQASNLKGPIEADVHSVPSYEELEKELATKLHLGGHYFPQNCRPTQRVAIIVPYRDRAIHLKIFLRHMHPFLQRQKLDYYIVAVEQSEGEPFNRALLFNIGFFKMNKLHNIDCFIFHDVDLLPLDDRILYMCQDQPVHLSHIVDTLGDNLMYTFLFGGAVALTPEMMETVNGFPNTYFGRGGEDDDMSYRIRSHNYTIARYSKDVARYTMMRHGKAGDAYSGKLDQKVLDGRERIHKDGLNTLVYFLQEFQPLPLYTWILIKPKNTSIIIEDKKQTSPANSNTSHLKDSPNPN